MTERFSGCLLGLALGDALGAPFEGSPPGEKPLGSPRPLLRYTDDTEMALGVAESLSEAGGFDPGHMAMKFAANFDPRRGYGPGAAAVLARIREGVPWLEASRSVFPDGSFGNGAAMRAAPLGLFFHRDGRRLREAARGASAITHAHPLAQEGALLIAWAVSAILRGRSEGEILQGLEAEAETAEYREKLRAVKELLGKNEDAAAVIARLGNGVEALRSAPTALYAFLRYGGDYLAAVGFCLSLGGDTDTIAAMAGALSGAKLGEGALPGEHVQRLEDAGRIRTLAVRLLSGPSPYGSGAEPSPVPS